MAKLYASFVSAKTYLWYSSTVQAILWYIGHFAMSKHSHSLQVSSFDAPHIVYVKDVKIVDYLQNVQSYNLTRSGYCYILLLLLAAYDIMLLIGKKYNLLVVIYMGLQQVLELQ